MPMTLGSLEVAIIVDFSFHWWLMSMELVIKPSQKWQW
jgi:hypothetical protein